MTLSFAHGRRLGAFALLVTLGLALSACLLAPGKFVSSLDIRKNGSFAFAYKGEISMLGVAQMAAMNKAKTAEVFKPEPCHDEAGTAEERKCTDRELAQQKKDWDEQRAQAAAKEKKGLDQMKAVLGGLDPTDPKSIAEFAARLRRQAGWNAVTYKGDGLFDVDYTMSGKLDHDFVFPIIERFPTMNTFVQLLRRTDGTVRVDAPGFITGQSSNPLMELMGTSVLGGATKDQPTPGFSQIDGSFTVSTDGQILANNTDEGPQPDPQGHKLTWAVNVRTAASPTALIKLGS